MVVEKYSQPTKRLAIKNREKDAKIDFIRIGVKFVQINTGREEHAEHGRPPGRDGIEGGKHARSS